MPYIVLHVGIENIEYLKDGKGFCSDLILDSKPCHHDALAIASKLNLWFIMRQKKLFMIILWLTIKL